MIHVNQENQHPDVIRKRKKIEEWNYYIVSLWMNGWVDELRVLCKEKRDWGNSLFES